MATLVLTAVGTVLGGPLGGAIGAALGQSVDQNILFKPKGREGPRLAELDVQTSTYGSQVPRIFGTMRVAGTVIWATDLKEKKKKSGGGKGQPSSTTYSYSVSFAVALSSRRLARVGRIWADGNLLRGAKGDFKTSLGGFRLMTGDPDQAADQLIASAEGTGSTPAYRGMAYAVFESLQLEDYGNRIPSLTFELFAEEEPVSVAAITGELSDGLLTGTETAFVDGYAASGENVSDAMEPLVDVFDLWTRPVGSGLTLGGAVVAEAHLPALSLAGRVNGEAQTPRTSARDAAVLAPRAVSVRHHDPDRDYQAGIQRAVRPGPGRSETQIELPAVISATQAKALATARVAGAWKGRNRLDLVCGWRQLSLGAGRVVTVEGAAGLWRIENWEWEKMALRLSLRQVGAAPLSAGEAFSGTSVRENDLPQGPTVLRLADLPNLYDTAPTVPHVVAAAAGASSAWRKASLFVEEQDEIIAAGSTAAPAVMGTCLSPPGSGQAQLFDDVTAFDVELLAEDMVLAGASDEALLRGANLCLAGDELLQFGRAEQTGPRQFRLSRLLRGRRGTEWAIGGHGAGEPFLLIEADALMRVPDTHVRQGAMLSMLAIGVGDVEPATADLMVAGQALLPPSPVHLRVEKDAEGNRTIRWTRRSRVGWAWDDAVDAPLGEELERYRVRVLAGESVLRTAEVSSAEFIYTAAMAAEDGAAVRVEVAQIGTRGTSRPVVSVV